MENLRRSFVVVFEEKKFNMIIHVEISDALERRILLYLEPMARVENRSGFGSNKLTNCDCEECVNRQTSLRESLNREKEECNLSWGTDIEDDIFVFVIFIKNTDRIHESLERIVGKIKHIFFIHEKDLININLVKFHYLSLVNIDDIISCSSWYLGDPNIT